MECLLFNARTVNGKGRKMEKSKILVQAVTPIVNRLNEKIKAIGLRRDGYLNSVFRDEVNNLVKELGKKRNSSMARDYLVSQLRTLPTTPVSIMLDKDVITAIDGACSGINMTRDCFINRVFFFLAAEAKNLDVIGISTGSIHPHPDAMTVNSLDNAFQFIAAPFAELHEFMRDHDESLYSWYFPGKLLGLNCYLPDEDVPGTKEHNDLESLLSDI